MIKEIVDNSQNISTPRDYLKAVAFICNSKKDFLEFIDSVCGEIEFKTRIHTNRKSIYHQTREEILKSHKFLYQKNDKIYALVVMYEEGYYHFYSRNHKEYFNYKDWNGYDFVDYTILLRKQKLKKIELL